MLLYVYCNVAADFKDEQLANEVQKTYILFTADPSVITCSLSILGQLIT